MLAKIHHSILQSWPVTTASIAMPKLEEGAGQAKLSQARGGFSEFCIQLIHFARWKTDFFVCVRREIYTSSPLFISLFGWLCLKVHSNLALRSLFKSFAVDLIEIIMVVCINPGPLLYSYS